MCGMCASHCPTYQLDADENESPRGRISLMRGLASGQLQAHETSLSHLDHCLLCRSCEKKCPSGVSYAQIYNLSQQHLSRSSAGEQHLLNLAQQRKPRQRLLVLARLAQKLGLTLFPVGQHLRTALNLLPRPLSPSFKQFRQQPQASVALFTGCANESFDAQSLQACLEILTACGLEVSVPPQQSCCGALAQHAGQTERFSQLQQINSAAFEASQTLLYLATGCGATLKDYPSDFACRTIEACHFISQLDSFRQLKLRPLNKTVAIHQPCSQRNVVGNGQATQQLLQHIPGIQLLTPGTPNCCGAGGSNMLSQPDIATQLGQLTLDALLASRPDYLVSTNIGCALHLGAQLRQRGLDIELLHPLVLIQRQLEH